jgi:hypothetical protein
MILSNKEVLNLLRIGLEDEIDLSGGVESRHATKSETRLSSASDESAKIGAELQVVRDSGSSAPPAQFISRERKAGDQDRAVTGSIPVAPISPTDRGLLLLALPSI